MDRPNLRLRFVVGSGLLMLVTGCGGLHHRRGGIPSGPPRASHDGGVRFNSDPRPQVSALNGQLQPTGPTANGGTYGPAATYGTGAAGNEPTSAPLTDPGPAASGEGEAPPRY